MLITRKTLSTANLGLFLGPVLFFGILFFYQPESLSTEGLFMLALTAWVATWWITEAIPISATALLPLVLLPISGVMKIADTAQSYSHPMVLLYMGGFMIAVTIEKWNLHKRIALNIIYWIGSNVKLIILGFMVATAFLSMWISNTATSLMMLPIAIAVTSQLEPNQSIDSQVGKALMLGVAYSASIGGLATLIGTPTNIIMASVIKEIYQVEISFNKWMLFGLPISILLLWISWYYLTSVAFSLSGAKNNYLGKEEIKKQRIALGPITIEEKRVAIIFTLVSFAWIGRSGFLDKVLPFLDDTIIALFGALLLFIIPSTNYKTKLLDWKTAEKIPWGILILFGGGLSIAEGFKVSGLALWIGNQFIFMEFISFGIILLVVIAAVNFLTEITSNMATASMLLPILAAVSYAMGVHPFGLMIGATLAASCAFMLPVATPPNAVVFGSGYLRMKDMVRAGIWMNLISIVIIVFFTYFLLPIIWDIDLLNYPF